ncbi:MAG: hypothetical protein JST68_26995 [Bacteroidetes bacterium]|nr:hypothetical protein [Bacteroidota bacterium]
MKRTVVVFVTIVSIVIINNVPPIRWLYGNTNCRFSNYNGTFTYAELQFNGDDFETCQEKFLLFKGKQNDDTVLYRLCPKNILHFWDYGQYIFSDKYRLPYKSWEEIDRKRGPITNKSGFQDF